MHVYKYDIVFQEVPNHISLAFYVCGCPLKCPGCHSPELWTESQGYRLTFQMFQELLLKYADKADCILFLGGEWHPLELANFLRHAKSKHFKTALYTGLDEQDVPSSLKAHLDFLKTGPWKRELGGLSSKTTNQVFMDLNSNQKLNHLFQN